MICLLYPPPPNAFPTHTYPPQSVPASVSPDPCLPCEQLFRRRASHPSREDYEALTRELSLEPGVMMI
jgi:hypothetical protein